MHGCLYFGTGVLQIIWFVTEEVDLVDLVEFPSDP
jgi:hypothetical protein